MAEYRLKPEGFEAVKKRVVVRIVATLLLAVGIVSFFSYPKIEPVMAAVCIAMMILVGAHTIRETIHRERVKWYSYCLAIDGDSIVRRVDGLPAARIERDKIVKIEEATNGLILRTAEPQLFITVPSALESYGDVRAFLTGDIPAVPASSKARWATYAIVAVIFAAMYFGFTSTHRSIRIATVFAGCGFGLWCFISMQRDPNLDKNAKTASWVFLAIILSIVAQVVGNLL